MYYKGVTNVQSVGLVAKVLQVNNKAVSNTCEVQFCMMHGSTFVSSIYSCPLQSNVHFIKTKKNFDCSQS